MFIIILNFIFSAMLSGHSMFVDSIFRDHPTETIALDNIEYSFYNYRVTWEEARIICLDYESQLTILDTEEKAIFITYKTSDSSLTYEEFWIGSKMNSKGFWIWTEGNNKQVSKEFLKEMQITPHYTNQSFENDFYCLTIFRRNHNIPMLIPLRCQERRPFICQKHKDFSGVNTVKIFSINIDNKDFILYSAKLTWSEAVVECRQRGFQIAVISNSNQAQILAIGMLRVRPRAIENAWIGGYMKNHIWKWLPTGNNITRNEMWREENMIYGDCLLLDRHICELPVYLSTKCDRKRNFFCQTSVENELNTNPIAVTLDTCQYWIGFHPLKWLEAKEHCKNLKATLIVLDSLITINHVLHIMIDNRQELQHIWIDGRKQLRNINSLPNKIDSNVWKWDSTGIEITGPDKGFIPWCNYSQFNETNADCLNMDREDFNIPLVYGVDCNNEQTYICQQRTTSCEEIKKKNHTLLTEKLLATVTFNVHTTENILKNDTTLSDTSIFNLETIENYSFSKSYIQTSTERVTISSVYSNKNITDITEKSIHSANDNYLILRQNQNTQFFPEKIEETTYDNYSVNIFEKFFKSKHKSSTLDEFHINNFTKIPFVPYKISSKNIDFIKLNNEVSRTFNNSLDTTIFLRLFNNTLRNNKYLNKSNNRSSIENFTEKSGSKNYNKPTSTTTIIGFKEIIEFVAKKFNTDKENINSSIVDLNEIKNNGNNQYNVGNPKATNLIYNNSVQNATAKENISRIIQSSINKNVQNLSTIKQSRQKKFYRNLSNSDTLDKNLNNNQYLNHPFSLINTNVFNGLKYNKNKTLLEAYGNDFNGTFGIRHNVRNVINKSLLLEAYDDHSNISPMNNYNKYDRIDSYVNSTSSANNNEFNYKNYSIKNVFDKINKTISKKTVQSLYNTPRKNETSINLKDLVKIFKKNFNKLSFEKQLFFAVSDLKKEFKRNFVKPWNVLLERVLESLNNTENHIGKRIENV